jgi:integrase
MGRKTKRRGRGEGAVFFSESKGCWVARAVVGVKPGGGPLYREVTAQTKTKVLRKKAEAEEKARGGISANADRMTVGEYLSHWLNNVSKPSVGVTTWESYERCVRLHLAPRIGGVRLGDLRSAHIEALFAQMQRDGVSGGHARKVSEILSTALTHAGRVELIRHNPASRVPKPKAPVTEIVPFTPDEIVKIRKAATGHRLEAMFALAISTGARMGELLGLGWEHLDLERGVMSVARSLAVVRGGFLLKEPKSRRGRRKVELPAFAVEALHEHRKRMLAEGNHAATTVFCTKPGRFIGKSGFIREIYAPLLERAGVPYRKFHTFRHTHVSELLSRGESVVDVARRVGDRPDVILKTYAHYIPDGGKKIAKRLDEMYG